MVSLKSHLKETIIDADDTDNLALLTNRPPPESLQHFLDETSGDIYVNTNEAEVVCF